jgi:hypothetical protein
MNEFPEGLLKVDGFTPTNYYQEADIFVVPPNMYKVGYDYLRNLPYMKGNEHRHVMLNISEWYTIMHIPAIMFRCDCTKGVLANDPSTIAFPWPVDNLVQWMARPFKRDVVFQGWNSTPLTWEMCKSVDRRPNLKTYLRLNDNFYGHVEKDKRRLRVTFLESLATSRLSLVPRSEIRGIVRYRFYEAMSMGRIPVHACDNCVMPFADRIDYSRCSITIPEKDIFKTGQIIEEWLQEHSDEEICEMGHYGREMWDRWLNRENWNSIFGEIVRERL